MLQRCSSFSYRGGLSSSVSNCRRCPSWTLWSTRRTVGTRPHFVSLKPKSSFRTSLVPLLYILVSPGVVWIPFDLSCTRWAPSWDGQGRLVLVHPYTWLGKILDKKFFQVFRHKNKLCKSKILHRWLSKNLCTLGLFYSESPVSTGLVTVRLFETEISTDGKMLFYIV